MSIAKSNSSEMTDEERLVHKKEIRKQISSRYYLRNRKAILERSRKYAKSNPEKAINRKRKWRSKKENKEKQKAYREKTKRHRAEYNAQYRKEHIEEIRKKNREYARKFRKDNPELAIQKTKIRSRKRRSAELAVEENFTILEENVVMEMFEYKCFNCNSTDSLTIDHHRPISKGYALELGNAVVLCKSCNSSKKDKDPEVFYNKEMLKKINNVLKKQAKLKNKK